MDGSTFSYRAPWITQQKGVYDKVIRTSKYLRLGPKESVLWASNDNTMSETNIPYQCTAISMDLIMLEQWISINCTEVVGFSAAVCERKLKLLPNSDTNKTLMLNYDVTICPEEFIFLNESCVVIEPVKLLGKNCLLQGKYFIVIPLCVNNRIEIYIYEKRC